MYLNSSYAMSFTLMLGLRVPENGSIRLRFGPILQHILHANTHLETLEILKVHGITGLHTYIPPTKIFLGLPAARAGAGIGITPVAVLSSKLLLAIEGSAKYGCVKLWLKYCDDQIGY